MGVFVLGTLGVWRGYIVRAMENGSEQVDAREDIKIERVKDFGATQESSTSTEEVPRVVSSTKDVQEAKETDVLSHKINLDVPFTSQAPEKNWEQPWQDACEEAAVLMLDAYHKKYRLSPLFAKDEMWKMVQWEEQEKGWGRSIEIEKMQELLFWYAGSQSKIITDPTVDEIKKQIAADHPVLVVADGKILPNPHFRSGGPEYHALIIRGYTETEFITNDPGTQFGKNFRYQYDDLMNAIRDWNGGDVKHGKRAVLVLE